MGYDVECKCDEPRKILERSYEWFRPIVNLEIFVTFRPSVGTESLTNAVKRILYFIKEYFRKLRHFAIILLHINSDGSNS